MKTPLLYGLFTGLATALLNLVIYLLGYHSDPAKMESVQLPYTLLSIGIGITGIILGTQARRAEYPLHEPFSYARALGAGILVGVSAAFTSAVAYVLYITVINPEFRDIVIQAQTAAAEKQGGPQAAEAAGKFLSVFFHPAIQFIWAVVAGTIFNTIISLITAAFLRRPAAQPVAAA